MLPLASQPSAGSGSGLRRSGGSWQRLRPSVPRQPRPGRAALAAGRLVRSHVAYSYFVGAPSCVRPRHFSALPFGCWSPFRPGPAPRSFAPCSWWAHAAWRHGRSTPACQRQSRSTVRCLLACVYPRACGVAVSPARRPRVCIPAHPRACGVSSADLDPGWPGFIPASGRTPAAALPRECRRARSISASASVGAFCSRRQPRRRPWVHSRACRFAGATRLDRDVVEAVSSFPPDASIETGPGSARVFGRQVPAVVRSGAAPHPPPGTRPFARACGSPRPAAWPVLTGGLLLVAVMTSFAASMLRRTPQRAAPRKPASGARSVWFDSSFRDWPLTVQVAATRRPASGGTRLPFAASGRMGRRI